MTFSHSKHPVAVLRTPICTSQSALCGWCGQYQAGLLIFQDLFPIANLDWIDPGAWVNISNPPWWRHAPMAVGLEARVNISNHSCEDTNPTMVVGVAAKHANHCATPLSLKWLDFCHATLNAILKSDRSALIWANLKLSVVLVGRGCYESVYG